MADSAYHLGIDINAYGLAFVLQTAKGEQVGGLRRSFGEGSGPGEHDPQDWWRGVRTGVKELLRRNSLRASAIRGISLTGMSNGCVVLDREGKSIFPALIGGSKALDQYAEQFTNMLGARNLRSLTGCPTSISGTSMAPKLLAIRDSAPRVWHDLAMILSPRDYLRFRMTGKHVTDPSLATRSLLFSPRNVGWSTKVLDQMELRIDQLPQISWGNRISGRITETAAKETGLTSGTPIVTGAGHQSAAAIACGATEPGDLIVELGSNGSVTCLIDQPKRDLSGILALGCHCIEDRWTLEHHGAASGAALEWLMSTVMPNEVQAARRNRKPPLSHFADIASRSPPGSDNLLILPDRDAQQPGALVGLNWGHSKADLIRSAMEASVIAAAAAVDQCREIGIEPQRAFVTGPGAKTSLWPQMLADALGLSLTAIDVDHLCARGAAVIATSATGSHKNLAAAMKAQLPESEHFDPDPDTRSAYRELRHRLRRAREALDFTPDQDNDPAP